MPSEDDLRRMFGEADVPNRLDAGKVIRRSRARRLPKQLAAGGASVLVLAGVTVLGVQSLDQGGPVSTAEAPMAEQESESGDSGGAADDSALVSKRLPADRLNLCGSPLAEVGGSQFGLVLDVVFPATAPANSGRIEGLVIMTNTGTATVTGTTLSSPAITLSQDGIALWHTNGAQDMVATTVDLPPGASLEYPAFFEPVRCAPEDDALEAFPLGLPPVGTGAYELSAALDFNSDEPTATTELDLVTGPRMPIVLE